MNAHAIISIDYEEPIGDDTVKDGDYYGVIVAYYNGGAGGKTRIMTGDVTGDFRQAVKEATDNAEILSFSSSVYNFIADSGDRYEWESDDSIMLMEKNLCHIDN